MQFIMQVCDNSTTNQHTTRNELVNRLKLRVNKLVQKIYAQLDASELDDKTPCIQWNAKGTGFMIINAAELTRRLSSSANRVTENSLMRQLSTLRFKKGKSTKEGFELRHPFFRRNAYKDLIMVRESPSVPVQSTNSDVSELKQQISQLSVAIDTVIANNNGLVAVNNMLINQLSSVKSACDIKMDEVLKMLINSVSFADHPMLPALKSVFDSFGIASNIPLENALSGDATSAFLNFYQNATNGAVSQFTLFERMTATFSALQMYIAHSESQKATVSLQTCASDTQSVKQEMPETTMVYTNHASLNRRYAKDDIVMEELRQVERHSDSQALQNVDSAMSLYEYSYTPVSDCTDEEL